MFTINKNGFSYPASRKELWGEHLWNPSYCAVTVSDRSREQILAYIEGQKEKPFLLIVNISFSIKVFYHIHNNISNICSVLY